MNFNFILKCLATVKAESESIAVAQRRSQKVNWPINLPLKAPVWKILRLFKDHILQIVNIYIYGSPLYPM